MGEGWMSIHPSRTILKLPLVTIFLFGGPPALAQETATLSTGNSAWILTSTALVLFMTLPGLALFYGGLVQSRNVLSVLMHCFTICCLVSVLTPPTNGSATARSSSTSSGTWCASAPERPTPTPSNAVPVRKILALGARFPSS